MAEQLTCDELRRQGRIPPELVCCAGCHIDDVAGVAPLERAEDVGVDGAVCCHVYNYLSFGHIATEPYYLGRGRMAEQLTRRGLFGRIGRAAGLLAATRLAAPLARAAGESALVRGVAVPAAAGTGTYNAAWSAGLSYAAIDVVRLGG